MMQRPKDSDPAFGFDGVGCYEDDVRASCYEKYADALDQYIDHLERVITELRAPAASAQASSSARTRCASLGPQTA